MSAREFLQLSEKQEGHSQKNASRLTLNPETKHRQGDQRKPNKVWGH